MHTVTIGIWGDSIAYGAWDADGGWADRLRCTAHTRVIAGHFSRYYWVYNLGIPGDTTRDVLYRFDVECEAREPYVIIISLGINDSSVLPEEGKPRVPIPEFRSNIEMLITKARSYSEKVFWIGPTNVDENVWNDRAGPREARFSNAHIATYRDALSEIAGRMNTPLIAIHDLVRAGDLLDGLHPNTEGHEKIFSAITDSLTAHGIF